MDGHNSGPLDCERALLAPNPSVETEVDADLLSELFAAGHGLRLSAEYARFGTSGKLLVRTKLGEGCRLWASGVAAETGLELLLRFLTGEACREDEGEGCLSGEGFRRPPAAADGGAGLATLYLEVISLFRVFRTAAALAFSAGGRPP